MKFWRFAFAAVAIGVGGAAACTSDDPTVIPPGGNDASSGDGSTIDAGGGDGSIGSDSGPVDAGPPHFCATQTAPAGAADFFCADFDDTNFGEGFLDASLTDGSTLATSSVVEFSPPNSLTSTIPDDTADNGVTAYLDWQKGGAVNLHAINVEAEINPTPLPLSMGTQTGDVYVMGVHAGQLTVDYGYTKGGQTSDASTYIGAVIHVHYGTGEVQFTQDYSVASIDPSHWTDVLLSVELDTGNINLLYEGVTVASVTTNTTTDTTAAVIIGDQNFGPTISMTWNFDNVRISTVRGP